MTLVALAGKRSRSPNEPFSSPFPTGDLIDWTQLEFPAASYRCICSPGAVKMIATMHMTANASQNQLKGIGSICASLPRPFDTIAAKGHGAMLRSVDGIVEMIRR